MSVEMANVRPLERLSYDVRIEATPSPTATRGRILVSV